MALISDFIQALTQQEYGLVILLMIGFSFGAMFIWLLRGRRISQLLNDNHELETTLRLERVSNEQLDVLLDQARFQLADTFSQLSNDALNRNNEHFL